MAGLKLLRNLLFLLGNPPANIYLDNILVMFLVLDDDAGLAPRTLVPDEYVLTGLYVWKRLSVV